jgi:hypothetical protein
MVKGKPPGISMSRTLPSVRCTGKGGYPALRAARNRPLSRGPARFQAFVAERAYSAAWRFCGTVTSFGDTSSSLPC